MRVDVAFFNCTSASMTQSNGFISVSWKSPLPLLVALSFQFFRYNGGCVAIDRRIEWMHPIRAQYPGFRNPGRR